jgi:hypothetical protein
MSHPPASIHDAVKAGDLEAVRAILAEDRTLINALDDFRYTPLDWAATTAEWGIFELLLKAGADVGNIGWDGGTVLHRACHYEKPEMAELLIRRGVDRHRQNQWGRSALHVAARRGHVEVAELLIKHGLDPDAATKEGWTPLHVAAKSGHPHMLEFLRDAGADASLKDLSGALAVDYFRSRPESIHLDPQELSRYVGDYATEEGFVIRIWQRDGKLHITDFGHDEMYPIGKDEFYCVHEPWSVTFFRNDAGRVHKMDLAFLRRTLRCRRIE